MVEQAGELVDVLVELEDLGIERRAARESEQLLGDLRTAIERVADALGEFVAPCLLFRALHQFEPARSRHEQIVEIVRHAAGKLAERLHLLCLPQGGLRHLARGYLFE